MPKRVKEAEAGMGYRGGRGKPGYPVPDVLKQDDDIIEKVVSDIVSSIASSEIVKKEEAPAGFVSAGNPLDIVVRRTVDSIVADSKKKKGEDLGFGFNEEGYPLQDRYTFQGMDIAIENKKGTVRAEKWPMHYDYGYVEGAIGSDNEPVDVYIGPDEDAEFAYVIHQNKQPKFEKYDEDKVMLGFRSEEAARKAYLRQYDDERFYGGMSSMPIDKFVSKLSKKATKITNEARGDTHDDVDHVTKRFNDKLVKRGIHVGSVLASGANGNVYDIGGGKILKVTKDEDEAKTSNHLKGKKLQHVVNISDVFSFPREGYWGIVQEKLSVLTPEIKGRLSKAFDMLDKHTLGWEVDWEKTKRWYAQQKYVDSAETIKTIEDLEIDKMVDELKKHDVDWMDIGIDNVMMRDGKVVAVDLGLSDSPGSLPNVIEIIESLCETVFDLEEPPKPRFAWSEPGSKKSADEKIGVVEQFRDKLKKRGIDVPENPRELGTGTQGTVVDLGGDRVLKVTKDLTDAQACMRIMGKDVKHLVKVFDVFRFPTEKELYGIVVEKLDPVEGASTSWGATKGDAQKLDDAIDVSFFKDALEKTQGRGKWKDIFETMKKILQKNVGEVGFDDGKKLQLNFLSGYNVLRKYNIPEMVDEVSSHGIRLIDYHSANIMRRGSTWVLADLGYSDVPGAQKPAPLEGMMRIPEISDIVEGVLDSLSEARVNKVGVTIGRYQPFHRGHAAVIRDLAKKFDRVIVLVAGNDGDKKKNPFSFDLRHDMMKKSLPDIMSKVEIHKAEFKGKGSGYLPGVLSDIMMNSDSVLEGDVAFHILVGNDRLGDIKKQIEHAAKASASLSFDPGLAVVTALPDVKNDDDAARISGTSVRQAIADDRKQEVEKLLDPHIVSNKTDFAEIYERLRSEYVQTKGDVNEAFGGNVDERDIEDALDNNFNSLSKKGIAVSSLKKLGSGHDGVAYDMGGGKVMKVTTNEEEARTSFKVLKVSRNSKHIVKVFDVFRFREDTVTRGRTLYGIITEFLEELSSAEKKEYDEISAFWLDPTVNSAILPHVWNGDYDKMLQAIRDFILISEEESPVTVNEAPTNVPTPTSNIRVGRSAAVAGGGKGGTPFSIKKTEPSKEKDDPVAVKKRVDAKMAILDRKYKKYSLPDMMRELKALGIKFSDFHSGNVMKRGNDYVINDLGRSAGGLAPAMIPQLENMVEDIISEIGAFTGLGSTNVGVKAGSSAMSSFKNRVDPNTQELWQNQLTRLQKYTSGSLD